MANNFGTDNAGFYTAKAIGTTIIVASNAIPVVGPVLSIGLGAIDAAGGFDGVYNYFNGW